MTSPEDMVNVRYMVDDVPAAIDFYTRHLGFTLRSDAGRATWSNCSSPPPAPRPAGDKPAVPRSARPGLRQALRPTPRGRACDGKRRKPRQPDRSSVAAYR